MLCYLSNVKVTHLACKYMSIITRQRSVCLAAVSDQYIINSVLFLQSLFFPAYISTFTPSILQPPPISTHFLQRYKFFLISFNWLIWSQCVKTTHRWKPEDRWRWKDQRGDEGNLTESSKTWRKMRDAYAAVTRDSGKERERPDQRAGGGVESVKWMCIRAVGVQAFRAVLTDGAACCTEITTHCANNTRIKHLYTSH